MKQKTSWIATLLVSAAAIVLAAFIGVAISNMSLRKPAPASDASKEEPTAKAPDESDESDDSSEEDPNESTDPEENPLEKQESRMIDTSDRIIRTLSGEELTAIRASYDGTVMHYEISEERDEKNRPTACLEFMKGLKETFGDRVHVFENSEQKIGLYFLLDEDTTINIPYLLNKLREQNLKATFFVNFFYLEHNETDVQKILENGHELGNMCFTTPDIGLANFPLEDQMSDIFHMHQYIYEKFGFTMNRYYWNADYFSEQAIALVNNMGYDVYFYTARYDSKIENPANQSDVITRLKALSHPGAAYFLDGDDTNTILAIESLLKYVSKQGLRWDGIEGK